MWFWTKWKLWLKLTLTVLPVLLGTIYFSIIAMYVDPTLENKLRPLNNCIDACITDDNTQICEQKCKEKFIEENTRGF